MNTYRGRWWWWRKDETVNVIASSLFLLYKAGRWNVAFFLGHLIKEDREREREGGVGILQPSLGVEDPALRFSLEIPIRGAFCSWFRGESEEFAWEIRVFVMRIDELGCRSDCHRSDMQSDLIWFYRESGRRDLEAFSASESRDLCCCRLQLAADPVEETLALQLSDLFLGKIVALGLCRCLRWREKEIQGLVSSVSLSLFFE